MNKTTNLQTKNNKDNPLSIVIICSIDNMLSS